MLDIAASNILITEFSKDPSIRQQARDFMEACGTISVTPTDRGMTIIDQFHLYYVRCSPRLVKVQAESEQTFKFLTNKPIGLFKDSPQFLHMLQAESEGLINISIDVEEEQIQSFAGTLVRCCKSMDYGEISTAWNELREEICQNVVAKRLVPAAARWVKDHLRGESEEFVAERCRMELEFVSRAQFPESRHAELMSSRGSMCDR